MAVQRDNKGLVKQAVQKRETDKDKHAHTHREPDDTDLCGNTMAEHLVTAIAMTSKLQQASGTVLCMCMYTIPGLKQISSFMDTDSCCTSMRHCSSVMTDILHCIWVFKFAIYVADVTS